ncbi:ankycorbin [Tetranychus urticae]|uniref:Uncharacterized protein n=1 Tax=Tetranychus urticae TaxID=32264 RepID=T1JYZ4_TETUR|nr:ankycorbin [Tetranychus urticae]
MKKFFPFTRRKGPSTTRIRNDASRHSIGSHSSVSNRSLVIQLIRGAYNIDLAKVDQSFSKLHKACFLNYDINKIKKYLKQGANPNQLDNASRSSPLHLATVNGNINAIRLLIEHGGNIDLPDGDGKTPVIKAIECFHKECLQFLILQGSDVNICDNQLGNTALHWSIINNFADGLKILLAYSPRLDINRKNKAGESPLHLLVRCPDLHRCVNDLLDKGAEIDIRNNQQRTPLMTACEHGHLDIARALVNRGSYIYHQDEAGFSALAIAKRNGHTSLVQYLTDLGGLESPRRTLQVETDPKMVDDSWPSTEDEDELEEEIAAAKTRKFDPIIQQLKSLQGAKQDDRLLQPSGTSQLARETHVKSSISGQSLEETKSLVGRESNHESNLMGPFNTLESFTKVQKEDSLFSSEDKSYEDEAIESSKKMKSSSLKSQDSRGVVTAEPTLGHIDSVYSHEASNDEFIREIKNLLDEEIRENDELDALLFATSVDPVSNSKDNNKVNDTNESGTDVDHSTTHHNQSSTSKFVHKSDSIESSALKKPSSDPATSASKPVNSEASTSTVETEKLKSKAGQSKNVIHVDILSDLWEDWAKSDETEEELSPVKAFNGLTKDFSDSKETAQKILPNEKEILGTFFLNDISDESSEEIEPEDDKEEEKRRKREKKAKEDEQVKKEKSTEAGRKKSLIKDETTSFSNDDHHEPISSSLTPNDKEDSANHSTDMSTNLMASQSKVISPPLPPPPPSLSPPPAYLLPPPPPSLLSTSTILPSTTLPPALPPRPGTSFSKDLYRPREKPIERSSIEVQTELDEVMPQLKELQRLKEESESKLKHLEMEMKKQSTDLERGRNKLIKEMNFIEEEKKMLERRLDEVIDSRDRLIEEKKRLTENEEKLRKQLKSFEECKCNQLKEELKEFKEKVKSRGNYNNDEFIRKLHDLNDECNDLRRELSAEQTALRDEISQLEKDKEVFKLENQWLKEKLEEMRDQMRRHLSSQDDGQKSNGRFERKRRKTVKGEEKEGEEDEEDKTLEEMRKVMVAIECLLTKLDDKISGLNLEEQKKLMEKIIIEIAKSQINQQVESMFKGIRSLLEDLHQELNSFQSTIEKQMNGENKNQSDDIQLRDSKDSLSNQQFQSKAEDALVEEKCQPNNDSNGLPTNKTTTNGFAVFESRISQLTSSIEKLEDNIERQELNMLIRARGHIWSSFDEDTGRCVQENSLFINMFNGASRKMSNSRQIYPNRPQSGFVQSLMKLQSTGKPSYSKLVNHLHANYEPSLLFDFDYTKNNLSKQIANLKSELGLTC